MRPSDTDDFATFAQEYLAPRHERFGIVQQVDAERAHEREKEIDTRTESVVNGISKNAPTDYAYRDAVKDGEMFKPNEDGSVDYPNKYLTPGSNRIAGFDLSSGSRITNEYRDVDGVAEQSVINLSQSATNDATGAPMSDQEQLSRIALVALNEGQDFEYFKQSLGERYTTAQIYPSWRAAQQARLADLYSKEPMEFMHTVPSDETRIEMTYTEDDLVDYEPFLKDAHTIYEYFEDEDYQGSNEDLAHYVFDKMSQLNAPSWGGAFLARSMNAPPEFNDAMYNALTVYASSEDTMAQFRRGLAYNVADPTNLLNLGLITGAGSLGARQAAREGLKKWMRITAASRAAGAMGAVEGAVYATLDDFYKQSVGMRAGEEYAPEQSAAAMAAGTVGGAFFGGTLGAGLSPDARMYYKGLFTKGAESLQGPKINRYLGYDGIDTPLTRSELQAKLKEKGLKATGTNDELQQRYNASMEGEE